jgi:putative membrane protein
MSETSPKAAQAEVKKSARTLAKSAGELTSSAHQQEDSADRRTVLAADRTVLAAERTYAAWTRTFLAALASGVGAPALLTGVIPGWLAKATGSVLIVFSGFCLLAAVWRELQDGVPPPRADLRAIPPSLLIGINGFLLLVTLAALAGVWAGDFRHIFTR